MLEYEIIDWKLKIKIRGLSVMLNLMGKLMTDVDLIPDSFRRRIDL